MHTPSGYPSSPMMVSDDVIHDESSKMANVDAALPAILPSSSSEDARDRDLMLEVDSYHVVGVVVMGPEPRTLSLSLMEHQQGGVN